MNTNGYHTYVAPEIRISKQDVSHVRQLKYRAKLITFAFYVGVLGGYIADRIITWLGAPPWLHFVVAGVLVFLIFAVTPKRVDV